MKQLVQNLRTGETAVLDVPAPQPGPNEIIVRNRASAISTGTERMLLEFSQKGLFGKARLRPDLMRDLMIKARRDGLLSTIHAVGTRLDQPIPLGYSCAGEVVAVGSQVAELRVGDRVACAGGGFAVHAEAVRIPQMLAARIPNPGDRGGSTPISFEEAAFTAIGSVALHGLRLASPQLGETVGVIGLGLVGLLCVQLARASGCRVVATDIDLSRCQIARELGCDGVASSPEEFEHLATTFTRGLGIDSLLVAAATDSNEPLELASRVARDRACIVAIGAVGTNVPRELFYKKELQFKVSRSYGPGRYDSQYEQQGHDYPEGYVRWTEGRNLHAFLELLSHGKVLVEPLISHRFSIASAEKAYELLSPDSQEPSLGVVIQYPGDHELPWSLPIARTESPRTSTPTVRLGLLGAGHFARSTLLPAIRNLAGTDLVAVCAASGTSAAYVATKYGFTSATRNASEVIHHSQINTVVIATRHDLHAGQVVAALNADKHVFCEKPLCLNGGELEEIIEAYREAKARFRPILMVGFNRRFAPLALKLKEFFSSTDEPLMMNYRVNAGPITDSHWTQDPTQGGGRIIGEVCHFVDLMTFLSGSLAIQVFASPTPNLGRHSSDNVCVQIAFCNGSVGVITYASTGDKAFSKERLEVFGGGKAAVLNDFRVLELSGHARRQKVRHLFRADKGHRAEWQATIRAILEGKPSPIPFLELVCATRTTFRIIDSLNSGQPEKLEYSDLEHG